MWVCAGNKPSQTGLCLLQQLFIKLQMFNSYYCKKYNVYSIICAFVQVFTVWARVSLGKLVQKWQVIFVNIFTCHFVVLCVFSHFIADSHTVFYSLFLLFAFTLSWPHLPPEVTVIIMPLVHIRAGYVLHSRWFICLSKFRFSDQCRFRLNGVSFSFEPV